MHSFANMYGAFDVVLYFVVIQLFWLLINLLLLSYLISNQNIAVKELFCQMQLMYFVTYAAFV